jgi:glycosyltransferase involved in cell wall biosynthesis
MFIWYCGVRPVAAAHAYVALSAVLCGDVGEMSGEAVVRWRWRMVWRRADHVVTVHDAYRDLIVQRGVPTDRVTAVLNAPDPALFHPGRRRATDPARFVAVFHGTVTERSGVVNAVRAMAEVSRRVPHAELRVIGTGNARAAVHAAIAELPPGAKASFDDRYVPLDEVVSLIADADVGVVPNEISRYTRHMLPVKLTEYAALGIPSLATRLPLTEHYVGEKGALLLDEATPAAIAAGLVQLAEDRGMRDRLALGARAFAEHHSWPRYGDALARAVGLT